MAYFCDTKEKKKIVKSLRNQIIDGPFGHYNINISQIIMAKKRARFHSDYRFLRPGLSVYARFLSPGLRL